MAFAGCMSTGKSGRIFASSSLPPGIRHFPPTLTFPTTSAKSRNWRKKFQPKLQLALYCCFPMPCFLRISFSGLIGIASAVPNLDRTVVACNREL